VEFLKRTRRADANVAAGRDPHFLGIASAVDPRVESQVKAVVAVGGVGLISFALAILSLSSGLIVPMPTLPLLGKVFDWAMAPCGQTASNISARPIAAPNQIFLFVFCEFIFIPLSDKSFGLKILIVCGRKPA
jgi:hypothetical protein